MRTSLREDHMKAFRQAQKAVMSNARCLTEGVDVPAVDMVAFISPRKSKVDIVQATGRAMRKSDETGKKFGYVMVPLFVEQAANESIEEALHRTGFGDAWDLLGAMREQDDVLIDIIRQLREDKGRTGGYDESRFSERVEVLGPSVSLDTIRESITAECLDYLGVSWDERFGELLAYKVDHGNTNVPRNDSNGLGAWITKQRTLFVKVELSTERKIRLDEIGFEWTPFEKAWETKFDELLAYQAEHGNLDVPRNYPDGLGAWVTAQRTFFVKGGLSTERKIRLDEIGFEWTPFEKAWETKFDELLAYQAEHGNLNVPRNYPNGLGGWITAQRGLLKNGKLSAGRKNRFEEIGLGCDINNKRNA